MILSDAAKILEAELLSEICLDGLEVEIAGAADLLSDVLAFSKPGFILLTGQISLQTLKTAQIAEAVAVVFVRGKTPDKDIVKYATENEIPLFITKMLLFQACGLLFENGIKSC